MKEKNILIITSDRTGLGHKSISTALNEHLASKYDGANVRVINGFHLAGGVGKAIEGSYVPIVRHAKPLWKLYYEATSKHTKIFNSRTAMSIQKEFLKVIDEFKPDLIVSVHPGFVGSILDILEKNHINIPFIVVIADMVTISNMWMDKRATYTVCPNLETKELLLDNGIHEDNILVSGFPIRNQFKDMLIKNISRIDTNEIDDYHKESKLKFLLICNAESYKRVRTIISLLGDNFQGNITIITGNNVKLKNMLEKNIPNRYRAMVSVYGYVENIIDYMLSCHMLITKGGPNTIMEAVNSSTPLVLIGALPGQEEGNNAFVEKNSLGVICNELSLLPFAINKLIENDMTLLKDIKRNQFKFRDLNAVEKISNLISKVSGM